MCTPFSRLPQAQLMRLDSFFFGARCVMSGGRLPAALFMVFQLDSKGAKVRESRNRGKRDILLFLLILAEQCAIYTIWAHASRPRHICFDSVQPLLALSEQRALCTFFSLLLSASLLRCGLMVSSPEPCVSYVRKTLANFTVVFKP